MNAQPYPVDGVMLPVARALSLVSLLQVAAEHTDQFQIQGEDAQQILWIVEEVLKSAQQANDAWQAAQEGEVQHG